MVGVLYVVEQVLLTFPYFFGSLLIKNKMCSSFFMLSAACMHAFLPCNFNSSTYKVISMLLHVFQRWYLYAMKTIDTPPFLPLLKKTTLTTKH